MQRRIPVLRYAMNTHPHRREPSCHHGFSRPFLVILFALLAVACASGSTLSGQVTDPQGNRVAAATVSVMQTADTSPRQVQTDDQGRFIFPMLNPGEYRITAESAGFAPITRNVALRQEDETTT